MNKFRNVAHLVLSGAFSVLSTAVTATMIDYTSFFIDNRANDPAGGNGVSLQIEAGISDPFGVPGNVNLVRATHTISGQQYSLPFRDQGINTTPTSSPYFRSLAYDSVPQDSRSGRYEISVTNRQGTTLTRTTHNLTSLTPLPLLRNVRITGSTLTPTINYAPLQGADEYFVRIFDGNGTIIYDGPRSSSPTFRVPSGVLQPGQSYRISPRALDRDTAGNLERRSVYVETYRPIIPVPVAAPLPPMPTPLAAGAIDSSKPVVVISHGWQALTEKPATNDPPPDWVGQMRDRIQSLLGSDGTPLVPSSNIITPVVPGFYTRLARAEDLEAAAAEVKSAGILLGNQLRKRGLTSDTKVQFIGHSLGSLENAYAVDSLTRKGITVDQFTILDRPFGRNYYPEDLTQPVPLDADQSIFRTLLPRIGVEWVDNYYGSGDPLGPNSTGASLNKADAFDHEYSGAGHSGVHERYFNTIPTSLPQVVTCPSSGGFLCSVVGGGFELDSRQLPKFWDPLEQLLKPTSTNLNDWLRFNCEQVHDEVTCTEGSPAYLWLPEYLVQEKDLYLSFDFQWSNRGDGDWLTLHLGDHLLFSFSGLTAEDSGFINSGLIPISQLSGEMGQLLFTLNSVGDANASINIRNVQFIGLQAISAPSSISLLLAGFFAMSYVAYRMKGHSTKSAS